MAAAGERARGSQQAVTVSRTCEMQEFDQIALVACGAFARGR
jgi:hypothetical protein